MKLLDSVLEKLASGDLPNKFTLSMGELIRKAREEKGFRSDAHSAKGCYRLGQAIFYACQRDGKRRKG